MKNIWKNQYGLIRSGWIILFCMGVYYGLQYGSSFLLLEVLQRILIQTGDINIATGTVSPLVDWLNDVFLPIALQILAEIIMIAIPLIAWKIMKYDYQDLGLRSFRSRFQKDGVTGMLLGFGSCTLIFLFLLITGNVQVTSLNLHFSMPLFWWIFIFLLVGFAEELFNRGLIMSILRRTNHVYMIVIIPSIIFGMIHLYNPHVTFLSILNIILIGIVFSFMYYKSGNLWMCIGYHITWNIFQSIVYGMPVSGLSVNSIMTSHFPSYNLLNGGSFGIEGGILTTIFSLFTLAFTFYYYRKSDYHFLS